MSVSYCFLKIILLRVYGVLIMKFAKPTFEIKFTNIFIIVMRTFYQRASQETTETSKRLYKVTYFTAV